MAVTQVYAIYAEIPAVTDYMNVKIGISIDTEDRLKALQTSNPFKLEIIKSFDAGVKAYQHEKHFHNLYEKYNTSGEWYKFKSEYFEDEVLPTMYKYFSEIEVIEGEPEIEDARTSLSLHELLEGIDEITNKSKYADKKIAVIRLEKAMTIADDNNKIKYQQKIDSINKSIKREYEESRRDSLERLAIKTLKKQAHVAKRRLQEFAMGYMVGCSTC
tara:strand:- start:63 stop:710 length:648 start_codon:yes stop_codon:yes gene_type:complete